MRPVQWLTTSHSKKAVRCQNSSHCSTNCATSRDGCTATRRWKMKRTTGSGRRWWLTDSASGSSRPTTFYSPSSSSALPPGDKFNANKSDARYWWICAIWRSRCAAGRSLVCVIIDPSRNNRPMTYAALYRHSRANQRGYSLSINQSKDFRWPK